MDRCHPSVVREPRISLGLAAPPAASDLGGGQEAAPRGIRHGVAQRGLGEFGGPVGGPPREPGGSDRCPQPWVPARGNQGADRCSDGDSPVRLGRRAVRGAWLGIRLSKAGGFLPQPPQQSSANPAVVIVLIAFCVSLHRDNGCVASIFIATMGNIFYLFYVLLGY